MSEFQLYHFRSIDRPLTEAERKEIGSWSSRTYPTATSATFTFSYRDFPKDEEKVVEKYFDAMLYASNWGTKRLLLRLPKPLADVQTLVAYTLDDEWSDDLIRLTERDTCYLLDLYFHNEEGGTWLEEDSYDFDDLTPLRDDILSGDYRALYLIWMQFALGFSLYVDEAEEEDPDEEPMPDHVPPPVPANLSRPTSALQSVIDFFEIDPDLVAAAQAISPNAKTATPNFSTRIAGLPENEKTDWLLRLANSEPRLDKTFQKHLHTLAAGKKPASTASPSLEEMKALIHVKEKERQAQEAESARLAHIEKMKQLAREEAALWKSIDLNLLKATGSSYDKAALILKDLQDLAEYQGGMQGFKAQMKAFREQYARKKALIGRFDAAGVV
jgi:hypothetical protein